MKECLRRALYDALVDLGDHNRNLVIYHIQKEHGIRFTGGRYPTIPEMEEALYLMIGSSSRFFINRFRQELEKYAYL